MQGRRFITVVVKMVETMTAISLKTITIKTKTSKMMLMKTIIIAIRI